MTDLNKLQAAFQSYILGDSADFERSIVSSRKSFSKKRLAIYSEAYALVLLEALEKCFPTVLKLLGKNVFELLGFTYIEQNPSRYFSIAAFGVHFSQFLKTTETFSHQICASELAEFEWSLNNVVDDTPDGILLTMNDLRDIPQEKWPDMSFVMHPCVRLFSSTWNVVTLFHQAQSTVKKLAQQAKEEANTTVIWRKDFEPHYQILTAEEAWCFQALQAGKSFGAICEGLSQWHAEDQVAQQAVNLLIQCLNEKMLSKVIY